MTGPPRDWDKELAEIDKLMAKSRPTSGVPAAAPSAPGVPAPRPAALPSTSGRERLATWGRVLLGVGLAAGMSQWPYRHACGLSLALYLGATGVVVVAGIWGAEAAWRRRIGAAHVLSLVVVFWGLALVAGVLLPRLGYAADPATWLCR